MVFRWCNDAWNWYLIFICQKKETKKNHKKNNKNLKIGYDLITLFFKYNYNTMAKVFYGHAR